ncbi:hypothetical protein P171DRAFT_438817 [Karstenula rhodostoma CBS 690.94]|uniref:Protein kinase domain-containing protein n=1 Tax=Karstenula rhodostoma CBS 690.94 TaxID=1392251 RepID=A0A9P4PXD3_9PLEO|nr:hypothetical protein P171DRAFT_438817 [Karstenula rhodostoma CBS 690.94]
MSTTQAYSQGVSAMHMMGDYPLDKYRPLSMAGSGHYAMVYFSLRLEDYHAFVKTKANNTFDKLRSKLVAVKVYADRPADSTELATLRAIQANADEDIRNSLASLIDHGHKWVASKAIAPAVTALDLEYPIPEEMVLNIILGMSRACRFLYENCAGRQHGDLHGHNMIIDTSSRDKYGLPRLVVIDFDQSKPVTSFNDAWQDFRTYVRLILGSLTDANYGAPVEGWDDINDYISNDARLASFGGVIDAIEAQLAKTLASTTPERLQAVREYVSGSTAKKEATLRIAFREAGLME